MNAGNSAAAGGIRLALGLPAADNLRQNVSSFEEAVPRPAPLSPPCLYCPRNPQVKSDERHAIELKLKYMAQRQLQNKKNCIRYNLQFIYEYVQTLTRTHTHTHAQKL